LKTNPKAMKKSRFSEAQILAILKEHESGIGTAELTRKHGISDATFYNWKKKYGGMELQEMRRLKQLEEENSKLKRMYANVSLEYEALKDLVAKKF
jgi:putative transposase